MTTERQTPAGSERRDEIVTTDSFVPHVSTVPANKGKTVGLFLREKALASTLAAAPTRKPHVVLMVHGGFGPSIVAYDLAYRDYSFMAVLARAGYDVFTFSHTGYGPSPRPLMDDPCNVDAEFQPLLVPHVLEGADAAALSLEARVEPHRVGRAGNDRDPHPQAARRRPREPRRMVDRRTPCGWIRGAASGAKSTNSCSSARRRGLRTNIRPSRCRSRARRRCSRHGSFCFTAAGRTTCTARASSRIRRSVTRYWKAIMAVDEVGATWGRDGEGIIRAPNRMNFGWRTNLGRIRAPTLMLLGEYDNYAQRLQAWKGLAVEHKLFIRVECASHFVSFERGRHLLYRAASEWLARGTVDGAERGEFVGDVNGRITAAPATRA